jgi:hypothetical protein
MELSGEEKRIQASFLELGLEDERVTPQFADVWNRANLRRARQRSALDFRIAAAVVTICLALFSLALLSRRWQRGLRSSYAVANGAVQPVARLPQTKEDQELVQQDGRARVVRKPRLVRFAPRSQVARLAVRQSAPRNTMALSRWQSPTTSLLRSPGDEVLWELPRLNQTLHNMKSFLSNLPN